MRVKLFIGLLTLVALAACGGGSSATRTVLVDFSSDEFASFVFENFPETVAVRPGDEVNFKQTWTGEPHTVTGGTEVDRLLTDGIAWIDFFEAYEGLEAAGVDLPSAEDPGDATFADFAKAFTEAEPKELRDKGVAAYNALRAKGAPLPDLAAPPDRSFAEFVEIVSEESGKAFEGLPRAFGEDDNLAQNVSQPCFLRTGTPPEDPDQACAKAEQRQPEFDGTHSYFNSGVIPYEGNGGNTFRVKIAPDTAPGTYLFYCAIHGASQRTAVEVVDPDTELPDPGSVARRTRAETKKVTDSLSEIYRDAVDDVRLTVPGDGGEDEEIEGPFAGLPGEEHQGINEFVPKLITAKVGEPVSWKMMGSDHTISFNVPKYLPIMEFRNAGDVRINPKIIEPAGGAVPLPEEDENEGGRGGVVTHDGGTFDGTGFWSSGLIGAQPYLDYTLRITKPGTYAYACLIHPRMIGRIRVT